MCPSAAPGPRANLCSQTIRSTLGPTWSCGPGSAGSIGARTLCRPANPARSDSQSLALIVAGEAGEPFVVGGEAGLVLIDIAAGAVAGSIAQRRVPSLLQPAVAVASRLAGRAQPGNDQGHHDHSHDRIAPEPHDRAAG